MAASGIGNTFKNQSQMAQWLKEEKHGRKEKQKRKTRNKSIKIKVRSNTATIDGTRSTFRKKRKVSKKQMK